MIRVVSDVQRGDKRLTPGQRLVVLLYGSVKQDANGTVSMQGTELASMLGMTQPAFSRVRKELVELGWLEVSGQVGHYNMYRLSDKANQLIEDQQHGVVPHLRVVGS
ncbi:helix-turn-helix domain-containing protein [Streptomyces sp. NPDC087440]|uniref:helix-turn-helix domain-containing protein n=1 Tax=Streptomyces sp. NPDC087440 TaxID=3365790 RepID=UPI0037F719D9